MSKIIDISLKMQLPVDIINNETLARLQNNIVDVLSDPENLELKGAINEIIAETLFSQVDDDLAICQIIQLLMQNPLIISSEVKNNETIRTCQAIGV